MEHVLISILFLFVVYLLSKVNKLEGRIKGMQYTLDQVANQSEIAENPINDELRELIHDGEDVKAVKKARETLGLSLIEGKEYIDQLKSDHTS